MKTRFAQALVTASFIWGAITSQAAVFTVDTNQTTITLSGTVLGLPIEEQSPGSLTTHFGGQITANITDSSVAFPGGSRIVGENSGSWTPKAQGEAGSEPANFGGKASGGFLGNVMAAVRNSQFDVTSSTLPLIAGNFDAGSLLFQFIENSGGSLDYSVGGLFATKGNIDLAGLATNRLTAQAAISGPANSRTLTIPIAADFYFELLSDNDVKLTITGQLVAQEMPASVVLFDNGNIFAVQNGPSAPTVFTISVPTMITYIHDYHYFNNGVLPGTIALRHEDGTVYGPWQTTGLTGQGGVPNAYWKAEPYVTIKAGKYTVVDSDPGTWSHNSASGFTGFTYIQGYPIEESLPALAVSLTADGEILVSWPKTATGFALFRKPALSSASSWTSVTAQPVADGDRLVVKLGASAKSEFYRLAR